MVERRKTKGDEMKKRIIDKRTVLMGIFLLATTIGAMAQSSITVWEYFTQMIYSPRAYVNVQSDLDRAGKQGWELVAAVSVDEGILLIYKRPKA